MSLVILLALAHGMVVATPAEAQMTLAGALADADSVDSVRSVDHAITFEVERAGEAYDLIAKTDGDNVVTSLEIVDVGPGNRELGAMSWLADAMEDVDAVAQLVVADDDGAVTVITSDGDRYLAIPAGTGNDAAVEARWAEAWS